MDLLKRFILIIYGWVGIIFSIILLSFVVMLKTDVISINLINDILINDNNLLIIACISVVIFIISLLLAFGNGKKKVDREPVFIESSNGKVVIALDTFESIVNLVLKKVAGITEYKVIAKKDDKDIEVLVKIGITSDVNMNELAEKIQLASMEQIEKTTGVKVKNIHVKFVSVTAQKMHTNLLKQNIEIKDNDIKE